MTENAHNRAANEDAPSQILKELERIYAGSTVKSSFVRQTAWLANDKALRTAFFGGGLIHNLPAFPRRRVFRLWVNSWMPQRLVLSSSAEAIQISLDGHRLRAFDATQSRSFKIVREASRYGAGTRHEVHVRQHILPGADISYPVIYGMEQKGPYLFVEEELVQGRAWDVHRDRLMVRETVAEPLERLYKHYGVSQRPLCSVLSPSILEALPGLDGSLPLVRHLRDLVERNPLVATSLCHGDVIGSNLAVTPAGIVFLDWEKAREYIVGSDLIDVALKYTRYRVLMASAVHLFEKFQGSRLGFADGLALHFLETQAHRSVDWARISRKWVAQTHLRRGHLAAGKLVEIAWGATLAFPIG